VACAIDPVTPLYLENQRPALIVPGVPFIPKFQEETSMPIYEYQCKACGHDFEAIQKISDAPLKDCPACNAPELVKLVSAAGFRLKGGGWYETDFKGDKDRKKNLAGEAKSDTAKDSAPKESAPKESPKPAATSAS
jgi:putative FmdB family regulatory protein